MTDPFRTDLEQALAPIRTNGHEYRAPDQQHYTALFDIADELQDAAVARRRDLYVAAAIVFTESGRDERVDRTMEEIERTALTDQRLGFIDTTPGQVLRRQYLADPAPPLRQPVGLAPAYAYAGNTADDTELAAMRNKMQVLAIVELAQAAGHTERLTLAGTSPAKRTARIQTQHHHDDRRIKAITDQIKRGDTNTERAQQALADSVRISTLWRGIDRNLATRATRAADQVLATSVHPAGPLAALLTSTADARRDQVGVRTMRTAITGSAARVAGKPYQAAPTTLPSAAATTTAPPTTDLSR